MTLGMAQQFFLQRTGSSPWRASSGAGMEQLLSRWYSKVDIALAKALIEDTVNASLGIQALICHLSAASQQGHLCIHMSADVMTPAAHDLFDIDSQDETYLHQLLREGMATTADSLFGEECPLVRDGDRVYFRRHWAAETRFLKQLQRLSATAPTLQLSTGPGDLPTEQANAIARCCANSITFLTGGPGTGKTYTAGQLLKSIWQSLAPLQRPSFRVALAAPTGKAAANLEASIASATHTLEGFPPIKAQTLHALLGTGSKASVPQGIEADLILVDECSMIDAEMFGQLFQCVPSGARLVLLGDADQLAAVEGGSLFADFVRARPDDPRVARLTVCLRTESKQLLSLANSIRTNAVSVTETATHDSEVSFRSLTGDLHEQRRALLSYAAPYLLYSQEDVASPSALQLAIRRFRLLSPLRKGNWGVEQINELLHQGLQRQGAVGTPILITANAHTLELLNGDIGLLMNEEAWFVHKGQLRRLPVYSLPAFELAYCLSVHKSQGSEFDDVLLVLPSGSERFGRELLYTGVTRARRRLQLWAKEEVLAQMLAKSECRCSGIEPRLEKMAGLPYANEGSSMPK